MARNTSADAQQLAGQMTHEFAMFPTLTHPRVAIYGKDPTFIVVISDLSAAAKKYGGKTSAAGMRQGLLIMGIKGVQTFPAGKGVVLGCGHLTRSGISATACVRYGKKHVGMVTYFNGVDSRLRDAASTTSQILSATGG